MSMSIAKHNLMACFAGRLHAVLYDLSQETREKNFFFDFGAGRFGKERSVKSFRN